VIQFDVSKLPDEITEPDLVVAANAVVEQLYKLKIPNIPLADPETGARFPSLVRIYIQCHLRRLLMFLEGGFHEYNEHRPLLAFAAARSMYESIAAFHNFSTQLCKLLDDNKFEEAAAFLMSRTFATRLPEHLEPDGSNNVTSILTLVQKLNKKVKDFEDAYNRMSEFVHPNAFGSTVHFHTITEDVATFHDTGQSPTQPLSYLILASFLSALFIANIAEIENRLKTISA
jgi:hypothetical protein